MKEELDPQTRDSRVPIPGAVRLAGSQIYPCLVLDHSQLPTKGEQCRTDPSWKILAQAVVIFWPEVTERSDRSLSRTVGVLPNTVRMYIHGRAHEVVVHYDTSLQFV